MTPRRLLTRIALAACCFATGALGGGAPHAAAVDFSLGWERTDGEFGSDDDVRLERIPLDLVFGHASGRFTISIPYVRISRTGNVTLTADGPAILGVGGPGAPPFQESAAGEGESGLGDIILRDESFLVLSGKGKRPALSFVLEYKIATADEKKGLGTGEADWGAGLSYTQPLSMHWQLLGDAAYRFTGSPGGLDFNDQLRLGIGLALITSRTSYRVRVENLGQVLDEVPIYNDAGAPVGMQDLDDRQVARFDIVRRSQRGGSTRLSIVKGFNDSSEDLGFVFAISTAAQ